MKNTNKRINVT